jgi:hypothetical protein|tara:strand:- start:80 stop:400 length:321 start_codon:yes stop_codon:yes gene_type:complete
MTKEFGPKGDGVLFPHEKQHEKQPNFRGKIELSREQLHALVDLAKESREATFQVLIGAWDRNSEKGDPYIYLQTEVHLPQETEGRQQRQYQPKPQPQAVPGKDPWD